MILLPFPGRDRKQLPQLDWLPLPLAPHANSRLRFAGPAGKAVSPQQALDWISRLRARGRTIRGIDIRGPGDGLARPRDLYTAVDLLRRLRPEVAIRVTTIGLGTAREARGLAEAGVAEVVLQVDAVDPDVARALYAWIRPGRRTIPLTEAVQLLVREQEEGAAALVRAGLEVRVRTTVYPGINDHHLGAIARKMASLGAAAISVLPFAGAPAGLRPEEAVPPPCDRTTLERARHEASRHLPLAGEETAQAAPAELLELREQGLPRPTPERPHVAVASSNGMDIDLHLGQADRLLIYGPREDGLACLLETRPVPAPRAGRDRWQKLASDCLYDCFAVLVANAGQAPRKTLAGLGIRVLICTDNIEGTVDVLFGGGKKTRKSRT